MKVSAKYDKNDVVTLSWLEQLRLRPGMYIGEIGDGSGYHDCIYVLLKEIVDNAVDEALAHVEELGVWPDGVCKVHKPGQRLGDGVGVFWQPAPEEEHGD